MSSFAILGGDQREARVAELLHDEGHDVAVFGLDSANLSGVANSSSLEQAVADRKWIVCPAPGLAAEDQLYAPDASAPLFLSESLLSLTQASEGGLVLGKQTPSLEKVAKRLSIPVHEFKSDRALAVVVASAVAEAVVGELIGKTRRLLRELEVTVLGYGATGSAIADALVALGSHTNVAARNPVQRETARRRGANPVPLSGWHDAVQGTDVVVNTVPVEDTVHQAHFVELANTTVLDISSPPGGLDHDAAREAGVDVIWARGLAGQRAPLTIGDAQYGFIKSAMAGDGGA